MNNPNLDENMMNNIKNMVDNGNISEAISQISPEMIQNFQNMLNNNKQSDTSTGSTQNHTSINNSNSSNNFNTNNNGNNNFDFSKIDMNTMMKISSMLNNMNSKDDPRANLIYSLKPYLRDSKKGKVDQYANLLNITKMADLFKTMNPEQPHD